jgi:hypothetical protein
VDTFDVVIRPGFFDVSRVSDINENVYGAFGNSWKTPGRWLRDFSHIQECDVTGSADIIFSIHALAINNRMHSNLGIYIHPEPSGKTARRKNSTKKKKKKKKKTKFCSFLKKQELRQWLS